MRNRAKCKVCESIIESLTSKDDVTCKCGQISVSGGERVLCAALNWDNFLRIDDNDNEIKPKVIDKPEPTLSELIDELDDLIQRIDDMPQQAMIVSINHYDYQSLLILLSSIFHILLKQKL